MKVTNREKKFKEGRRTIMIGQYLVDSIQIRQVNLLKLNRGKLILGGYCEKIILRFYSELKASENNDSSLEVVRGIRGEA
jgi:hypothetical protein